MLFIHSIPNVHLYIIPVLQAENSLWSEKGFSIILNTTDKNLGRAAGRKSSSVPPHVLAIQNYILHQINKHCIKYSFFLTILDFNSSHRRHFYLIYVNNKPFLPFSYFTFKFHLQTKGQTLFFFHVCIYQINFKYFIYKLNLSLWFFKIKFIQLQAHFITLLWSPLVYLC